ncbi:hypothetical protein [Pseudomonas sp. LT1P18]|uniref:hypothetical protein n=1 Tax=Pseudomonas arabinosi TaxID=3398357 RepID=UPI0039EE9B44
MSEFKELSQRYAECRAANSDQLRRLVGQARQFALALEDYLGLPAKTWTNNQEGNEMAYVRVGQGQSQNFEEKYPHEFSSLNGVVDFSVSVTLESAPSQYPKTHHIFQFAVAAIEGGYEFTSKDFGGSFKVGAAEDAFHAYEQLCAAVVNTLKNSYDVSKIH